MNKIALLLAVTLLMASPITRPEATGSVDLTYCLDLPTAQKIAKCSGEISAGSKGRTYSKAEVEKILSEENTGKFTSPSNAPVIPATSSSAAAQGTSPEKAEGNNN